MLDQTGGCEEAACEDSRFRGVWGDSNAHEIISSLNGKPKATAFSERLPIATGPNATRPTAGLPNSGDLSVGAGAGSETRAQQAEHGLAKEERLARLGACLVLNDTNAEGQVDETQMVSHGRCAGRRRRWLRVPRMSSAAPSRLGSRECSISTRSAPGAAMRACTSFPMARPCWLMRANCPARVPSTRPHGLMTRGGRANGSSATCVMRCVTTRSRRWTTCC